VKIPRFGTIQYHPSLLPKYRGPSAIGWSIALGETKTGLTIFRPSDGLDEGAIILQKEVPIGPDDTLGQVYFNHLFPLGIAALLEAADLVAAGKHQEMVQDESQANYEGWFDQAAARIHWSNHVSQIYNLIRACNPAPGAWTALNGEKVQIYDVRKHITQPTDPFRVSPAKWLRLPRTHLGCPAMAVRLRFSKPKPERVRKSPGGSALVRPVFRSANSLTRN
jgi:methionyl-tRNA formyltransferase